MSLLVWILEVGSRVNLVRYVAISLCFGLWEGDRHTLLF